MSAKLDFTESEVNDFFDSLYYPDKISTKEFFFDDINCLIGHIVHYLDNPTPLKVQKSLYFLWAFYAATYGNIDYEEETEFSQQDEYPRSLFKANFEARHYGPVLDSVFADYHHSGGFKELPDGHIVSDDSDSNTKEVWSFIDDLLFQINEVNDFGLVERSQQDSAWKNAYIEGQYQCKMNNEEIKEDYVKYVRNK